MIRAYRYFYYRIYAWNLKQWGEWDFPQFNACLGLTGLVIFNFFSILILAGAPKIPHLKAVVLILYMALLLAHYLYFVRSGRFRTLEEEFRVRPFLSAGQGLAVFWGYVAGSIALLFGLLLSGAFRSAA